MPDEWVTKDSGKHAEYASGMRRDTDEGKPRFDLLFTADAPYSEQFLTRIAGLLTRGAVKYGARNHEQANSQEELDRMRSSALRHMFQWLAGEQDEDHAAAVAVNLMMAEMTAYRMEQNAKTAENPERTEYWAEVRTRNSGRGVKFDIEPGPLRVTPVCTSLFAVTNAVADTAGSCVECRSRVGTEHKSRCTQRADFNKCCGYVGAHETLCTGDDV